MDILIFGRAFWSFQILIEVWTCLNLFLYDREFNLSSFGTGLDRFGLKTKKLWPKRTKKDLFVRILYL